MYRTVSYYMYQLYSRLLAMSRVHRTIREYEYPAPSTQLAGAAVHVAGVRTIGDRVRGRNGAHWALDRRRSGFLGPLRDPDHSFVRGCGAVAVGEPTSDRSASAGALHRWRPRTGYRNDDGAHVVALRHAAGKLARPLYAGAHAESLGRSEIRMHTRVLAHARQQRSTRLGHPP